MKIIVGLGNIGEKYEKTRHNVGFMTVNALAEKLKADWILKPKFQASLAEATINSEKVLLVKPTTYMNHSGNAIASISQFYKVSPEDVITIYDDIDLPIGAFRIRKSGSAGTHNGMKSIVAAIGENCPRIRIGIKNDEHAEKNLSDVVLSSFGTKERPLIEHTISNAITAIDIIFEQGIEKAMSYPYLAFVIKDEFKAK
ncbi:MAG: peptidyl-tRNA hydrolase, peptidyl-tRNA hydrolase, PTH1 family [Candidatus Peregrinibacteria bacterium GW2011_GWF2_38_29]|nr:MAG: peptidyl-tRNA hydrolase, peptidyl-tRNA hydrolase, PTH1 family [Candidatus Peregrinibacteria bacterium GW2011_GWF2_38_29]